MKRCPTCDKTFPDSMRFCQTDGTVLIDDAPPVDPYKTVVGNQSDIAAAIPPLDPFKTMVATPPPKREDDVLDLPPSAPPLPPPQAAPKAETGDAPKLDLPPAPPAFGGVPIIEPKADAASDIAPSAPPLPDFGDSAKLSDATAVMDSGSFDEPAAPPSPFDSKPFENDFSQKSPYGNLDNKPIPSPFQDSMPPGYKPPSVSPFADDEPPTIRQPEPILDNQAGAPDSSPFGQPSPPPFAPPEPFNQPFQQQQQNEWTPPPAPVAEWQNQNIGQNTPFQPPPAGAGLNQTLPIVSLVLGIISVCCYVSPLTGLAALITGYLGMKNANQDPNQYGGKGLAIAGMIVGGIFFVIGVLYYILILLGVAANLATMGR